MLEMACGCLLLAPELGASLPGTRGARTKEPRALHAALCTLCCAVQDHAARYAAEITELLGKMPRVLLLLLKTNDCLRCAAGSAGKR